MLSLFFSCFGSLFLPHIVCTCAEKKKKGNAKRRTRVTIRTKRTQFGFTKKQKKNDGKKMPKRLSKMEFPPTFAIDAQTVLEEASGPCVDTFSSLFFLVALFTH